MASFAVLIFLLFAGMDYGTQRGAEFNEVEMALENAIAGSETATGCKYTGSMLDSCFYKDYQIYKCRSKSVMEESSCGYNPNP